MLLIIAEKSAQGQDILDALSPTPARMANGVGRGALVSGMRFVVAALEGHAFELAEPPAYDAKWADKSVDLLPIYPASFAFKHVCKFGSRIREIAALSKTATEVCNACDAAREGEGIFDEVALALGWYRVPIKLTRLWLSNLEPNAVRRAFQSRHNLLDPKFRRLALAAAVRREADWIYGINGSRCVTHYVPRIDGSTRLQAVGRVQTPVLYMIYEKSAARRTFKPRLFYRVVLRYRAANGVFEAVLKCDPKECVGNNDTWIADAEKAAEWRRKIFLEAKLWTTFDEVRQVEEGAPPPFNMVELQRACARIFRWSAKRTESAARRCYREHKAITYPGTESTQIPKSLEEECAKTFFWGWDTRYARPSNQNAEKHLTFSPNYIVPDEKIEHDHHAILPLRQPPPSSDYDAVVLWDLILRRFLTSMSPRALINACSRTLICDTGKDQYRAYCDEGVVAESGWLLMESFVGNTKGEGMMLKDRLSRNWVTVDEPNVTLISADLHQGATTPPDLHTYDSILGKMVEKGLGTAATRHEILDGLIVRRYVDDDRGDLDVSMEGAHLCNELIRRAPRIVTTELAQELEGDIAKIEEGKKGAPSREKFLTRVVTEITNTLELFRKGDAAAGAPVCPFSGEVVEDKGTVWEMPGLRKAGITFPKVYAGRKMEVQDWIDVVVAPAGRGKYFPDFKNGAGVQFGAHLTCILKGRTKKRFRLR